MDEINPVSWGALVLAGAALLNQARPSLLRMVTAMSVKMDANAETAKVTAETAKTTALQTAETDKTATAAWSQLIRGLGHRVTSLETKQEECEEKNRTLETANQECERAGRLLRREVERLNGAMGFDSMDDSRVGLVPPSPPPGK